MTVSKEQEDSRKKDRQRYGGFFISGQRAPHAVGLETMAVDILVMQPKLVAALSSNSDRPRSKKKRKL